MKSNSKFAAVPAVTLLFLTVILTACGTPQSQPTSQANKPPIIEQISGFSDWAPDTSGEISVVARDPNGDKLSYAWQADNGTLKADGNTAIWTAPSSMGKYNIVVVVTNGRGGEARATKEVRVGINADGSQTLDAPVLLKMSIPSAETVTGTKRVRIWTASPAECVVSGADPKDLKFTWTASNGRIQAKGLDEGTASKVVWIAPGVGGDWTLDVVVTDSRGNQAKGTVKFTVYCCGNY
jgi:hypothetical protein